MLRSCKDFCSPGSSMCINNMLSVCDENGHVVTTDCPDDTECNLNNKKMSCMPNTKENSKKSKSTNGDLMEQLKKLSRDKEFVKNLKKQLKKVDEEENDDDDTESNNEESESTKDVSEEEEEDIEEPSSGSHKKSSREKKGSNLKEKKHSKNNENTRNKQKKKMRNIKVLHEKNGDNGKKGKKQENAKTTTVTYHKVIENHSAPSTVTVFKTITQKDNISNVDVQLVQASDRFIQPSVQPEGSKKGLGYHPFVQPSSVGGHLGNGYNAPSHEATQTNAGAAPPVHTSKGEGGGATKTEHGAGAPIKASNLNGGHQGTKLQQSSTGLTMKGNDVAGKPSQGEGNGAAGKPTQGGGNGAAGKPAQGGGNGAAGKSSQGEGNGAAGKPAQGGGNGAAGKPAQGGGNGAAEKPAQGEGNGAAEKPTQAGENGAGGKPAQGGENKPSGGDKPSGEQGTKPGTIGGGTGEVNVTSEQVFEAMSKQNFNPKQEYVDAVVNVTNEGFDDLNMAAMFLAQLAHESGGFEHIEEIDCKGSTKCADQYGGSEGAPGKSYHGRGFIQLSWPANYKAAGEALGMGDELFNNPDLVCEDPELGAKVSLWFWKENVENAPGVSENHFGATTKAINGALECTGSNVDKSKKRYEIYKAVAEVLGVSNLADESGCY